MMGTLAALLAGKKIRTFEDLYSADVEGDIENVNGILKITTIRVKYHLKVTGDQKEAAREAFASYLSNCPAAQSVIGCIKLQDELDLEEISGP
ncbi:MAG: OsmC family protein [Syntrophobacteraceae bacterium]